MITSEQLLNYQFTKAGMNGYKGVEVDEVVSSAAETISFYEKKVRDMQRIIEDMKKEENIIQTTLVNAQKLANQITEQAQQQADEIMKQAQQQADGILANNEAVTADAAAKAEKSVRDMIENAKQQAGVILENAKKTATDMLRLSEQEKSKQDKLLAALKKEVAKFRADVLKQYETQMNLIVRLPEMEDSEQESEEEENENAGSSLVKLLDEMKENEVAAAQAVEEVAELTVESDEPAEEETVEQENQAEVESKQRTGGFNIVFDDDDDE